MLTSDFDGTEEETITKAQAERLFRYAEQGPPGTRAATFEEAWVALLDRSRTRIEREFYILSLSASANSQAGGVWWWYGPRDSGYTMFLENAGRYPESQVRAHLDYYNNGERTLAVPCEYAEAHAKRAVYQKSIKDMRDNALDAVKDRQK